MTGAPRSVRAGDELPGFTMVEIDAARIRAVMEIMGDVNPVHDDPALVARLGLRGPVNQGPANLAYVMNMLLAWSGDAAALERIDFRFTAIVTLGDEVTAGGAVTAVDGARVECDVWLDRADGVRAVAGVARLRVGR